MTEDTLNDVFRPTRVQKRAKTSGGRGGFGAYAKRRSRQMLVSWLVLSVIGFSANMALQQYAEEEYGIDLHDQLTALDQITGGVLNLASLAPVDAPEDAPGADDAPVREAPRAALLGRSSHADNRNASMSREITSTGALRVTVPQSGN